VKVVAITSVKNEGAVLLEWLAHHWKVGFTDFLVFSNDCDDGTDLMLDRLQNLGWLRHVRNPGPWREGPQWAALKTADRHPLVRDADWLLFLDVDEFVNIHVGDHTIGALLHALPDATAITLTWRVFGNAGVVHMEDRPVTETFVRAAPAVLWWPWRAVMFKTLFRNDGTYRKLGVHRPRAPDRERLERARWFDGSGRPLGEAFRTSRVFSDYGHDNGALVQLNHYALGSMEGFIVKCDRGRANRAEGDFDAGYWIERNFSAVEDRTIAALDSSAERREIMADPVLSRLHGQAVRWRHERFTQLMREERWRALFSRLLLCQPTRVLTPEDARIVWQHAVTSQK
jgi:hypothetical protein